MRKLKLFTILLLFTGLLSAGFSCRWNPFASNDPAFQSVTLQYWGVWDTPQQLASLIESYEASHPTIKIEYRNFRYEEYERKLLEAWADDRGPDIFAIPTTWLKEYEHRLEPMPKSTKIPVQQLQGTIKEELITSLVEFKGLSPYDIQNKYVPVVYDDVIIDGQIYGLPYYLDTLVTFYNSDLLTKEGIPEPITDFHDLVAQTPKLTKASEANYIYQSAVALGGTTNIPRFFDIFSSIMLQNGVTLGGSSFQPLNGESAERFNQALSFYTDFARPGKASYSWNSDLDNAFELFVNGKLAYFFGYSYHADELRKRGTQFSWDIINFPQTRGAQGSKYYANYWINVVSKKSNNQDAAWNFIQSTASQDMIKDFLIQNKKPTALRALYNEQLADNDLRIFASQVLTADNWYNGYNIDAAEKYTAELLDGLIAGEGQEIIQLFINQINQTYEKPKD